jgi:hypothetical protein
VSGTESLGRPTDDRVVGPKEIEAGRSLARELREHYKVRGILVVAAEAGRITELRCGMPYCFAADPGTFDPHGVPLRPWMPTHEHFPLAKRHKGKRDPTNAVLAHRRCNNVGYKIEELRGHLEALRFDDGGTLNAGAIDAAIADNVKATQDGGGSLSAEEWVTQASGQDRSRRSESFGRAQ